MADTMIAWEECDREDISAMIALRDKALEPERARRRQYYDQNKERMDRQNREWRARNPQIVRDRQRGYGAKRRSKIDKGVSGKETRRWLLQQRKVCHWCGKACRKNFHVDHIRPLSRGGAHEFRNLCISCPSCNLTKHARDPIDFARSKGLLL